MLKRIKSQLPALLLVFLVFGCGASLAAIIAKIVAVAAEADGWVQTIADFAEQALKSAPDTALTEKLAAAVQKAKLAALALDSAAQGAGQLSQDELEAAFVDFRQAYADLLEVVGPLGVRAEKLGVPIKFGLTETGGLRVPPPEYFSRERLK